MAYDLAPESSNAVPHHAPRRPIPNAPIHKYTRRPVAEESARSFLSLSRSLFLSFSFSPSSRSLLARLRLRARGGGACGGGACGVVGVRGVAGVGTAAAAGEGAQVVGIEADADDVDGGAASAPNVSHDANRNNGRDSPSFSFLASSPPDGAPSPPPLDVADSSDTTSTPFTEGGALGNRPDDGDGVSIHPLCSPPPPPPAVPSPPPPPPHVPAPCPSLLGVVGVPAPALIAIASLPLRIASLALANACVCASGLDPPCPCPLPVGDGTYNTGEPGPLPLPLPLPPPTDQSAPAAARRKEEDDEVSTRPMERARGYCPSAEDARDWDAGESSAGEGGCVRTCPSADDARVEGAEDEADGGGVLRVYVLPPLPWPEGVDDGVGVVVGTLDLDVADFVADDLDVVVDIVDVDVDVAAGVVGAVAADGVLGVFGVVGVFGVGVVGASTPFAVGGDDGDANEAADGTGLRRAVVVVEVEVGLLVLVASVGRVLR
ncbi:hypothetical protein C8R45DRAFT_1217993 [Mycena sanguinolenta]|nr:hypothetical protein C8R45DRAFT_1217993 [Mycena sanguinolenta]